MYLQLELSENLLLEVTEYSYTPDTMPTMYDPGCDEELIIEEWQVTLLDENGIPVHTKENSPFEKLLDWGKIEHELLINYQDEL